MDETADRQPDGRPRRRLSGGWISTAPRCACGRCRWPTSGPGARHVARHSRCAAVSRRRLRTREGALGRRPQGGADASRNDRQQAFWAAMYPAHPYGRQATPESVTALLRDDVLAFHARPLHGAARHHRHRRRPVARAGRGGGRTLTAVCRRGRRRASRLPQLPAGWRAADCPSGGAGAPAARLPALKRGDPDFFPLAVGNYSLGGGGFVSRLMKEVRDKRGLAYSVHSYFCRCSSWDPFQIGCRPSKGAGQRCAEVTREVLAEFLATGPSEAELQAAKQNLIGSFPLRLDSNRKILENVAMIGFYGLPLDYLDRYPENIERVTAAEIQAAFARHVQASTSGDRGGGRRIALNSLRIIGGEWRRRILRFPDSAGLRPTPDRVRETLFNWLGQDLTGAFLPRSVCRQRRPGLRGRLAWRQPGGDGRSFANGAGAREQRKILGAASACRSCARMRKICRFRRALSTYCFSIRPFTGAGSTGWHRCWPAFWRGRQSMPRRSGSWRAAAIGARCATAGRPGVLSLDAARRSDGAE
jgi:hypothetical protein